ncbi:MAG TPA: YceI family protein [Bacteroidales bacterium]
MKMQFWGILLFVSILFTGSAPPESHIYKAYKGAIRISSDAPLEIIRASSQELKGAIDADKRTFAFSIRSLSIRGFNSPLQQIHFYENYIEAKKFPVSTFAGKIIEQIDFTKNGDYSVRAKGILTIHGVAQERIIKSSLRVQDNIIYVKSKFSIILSEHNITIPKVVYQKIAQEIIVDVDAEFAEYKASKK